MRAPLTTREKVLHADSLLYPLPSARAPSATISWAGSDALAHTEADGAEAVDPHKIAEVGRMTALASDPAYLGARPIRQDGRPCSIIGDLRHVPYTRWEGKGRFWTASAPLPVSLQER